ncbi:MAG: FAD:protein FMN transferase [Deltaproteobacteria bacterium]|nr:FAD:protein FMN transferase [Deltaproteobacteria bacterium]
MLRRTALACLACLLLLGSTGAAAAQDVDVPLEVVERYVGVMGTDLQIRVLGPDRAALNKAVQAAEVELRRVEDLMTDWRSSPLTSLNAAAGSGPVVVPRELAAIISRGVELGRLTRGAFDITYAGVGRLWDFKRKPPIVPEAVAIKEALADVGFDRIQIDPATNAVTLPANMRIGLGGMAKGYGVDRAMQTLLEHGIEHALVNAGGDLKALGRDEQEPWEVAVKHPRDRERAIAVLRVSNSALVTSGDYERFFEHRGKRFHHILDPRTGYPSTGAMSATVIAPSAELADALATALCVLGPIQGLEIIDGLDRVEAILIDMDGAPHASAGLRASLKQ